MRRRVPAGSVPGGGARRWRGGWFPPAGAGGASRVTSAGRYKREAPRGTPAAEAAPAAERRDARRGPDRGTHAAGPLLASSSPRALRHRHHHRIASPRIASLLPHRTDMMYQGFAGEYETPSSRCSSASPAGDSLTYYPSPADSFSSMGSPVNPQDFCTDLAVSSASFVPTVTAISTSPDLQWLVQPTLISSVAPSQSRGHPYGVSAPAPAAYSRPAALKAPGGRGQSIGRRGKVEQLSPEEEEKRRIRRERNKMAAAKCRNRRRELTDTLQAETDQLEEEKSALQAEIANLLKEKEKLEFILAAHRPACKMPEELRFSEELAAATALDLGTPSPPVAEEAAFTLPLMSEAPPAVPPKETGGGGLELKAEPFDELLFSTGPREASRSVPDMDLPGASSFYASDWESLGAGTSAELEPLCTPVVTCTPCPSTYTSTFVFTYPEADAFPSCAAAHRKGSSSNEPSSDSLSSPTLLAL